MKTAHDVWLEVWKLAEIAGKEEALECEETMLKIAGYAPFPICGFAWITVKPGNCAFANWLKKTGRASKAYGGGVQIWVRKYGQSHDKKQAYAYGFADMLVSLLEERGIMSPNMSIFSGSRLD